jgi:glycosyltransferase involved in cell wall biosynthesis
MATMGRYLLVSGDFVKTGGMDRANHALASYLADRGDEVHLVAYRVAPDLLAKPNVIHHRVKKPLNSYFFSGPLFARAGKAEARRIAGRGGRVVVNGGNCDWDDVNWVHHVHASDAPTTGGSPLRRLKTRVAYRRHVAEERKIVPKARLILTGCERSRSDVLEKVGGDPSRAFAVYYGVDAAIFRPAEPGERAAIRAGLGWAEDRPKVAFVGALADRRKGFDRLFAAWEQLCRDPEWDADLVVVGRGAEVPAWKQRAEEAGLADRVAFLGFVADLPSLYRACDAHCLPSRYEGYSLVTQEALASGIPAFVSTASGIAERYPESLRDLLIPDPEDVTDLARRLRDWRGRMAAYREAVAPLSRTLRETTWEAMAARIAGLIES